jgi:hypothetical protein
VKETYAKYVGTFKWTSPYIQALQEELEEDEFKMVIQNVRKRIRTIRDQGKQITPESLEAQLQTIETQLTAFDTQFQQALRMAAFRKPVLGTPGFWDEIERRVFVENDFNNDMEAVGCVSTWISDSGLEKARKLGLLGNLSESALKRLENGWDKVQSNLALVGLRTVADLKREGIFNLHLLEIYFSRPATQSRVK